MASRRQRRRDGDRRTAGEGAPRGGDVHDDGGGGAGDGGDSPTAGGGLRAHAPALLSAAALFVLYVATLAPSIGGGDSGTLTAAAATGGVAHPPGYPLYCLLGRLASAVPFGPGVAWRVNLLSAVFTAAAAGLLAAAAGSWTGRASAGVLAAALFGTNPVVWRQATGGEVFGLHALLIAGALLLWLRCEREPVARRVYALALWSGLGMTNHHTFVFVGAPLLIRALWMARASLGPRGIATAVAAGALGLLPYAYLPIASASASAVSWGDQTSLGGLLVHVLRREYGTLAMGQADSDVFLASRNFGGTLAHLLGGWPRRLLVVGPVLAVVGLWAGMANPRTRARTGMLALVLGVYVLGFAALSNLSTAKALYVGVLERFFIQADLLASLAAGLGVAACGDRAARRWRLRPDGAGLVALSAGLMVAEAALHLGDARRAQNTLIRDFVAHALGRLPPAAVIITSGDNITGAALYLLRVEGFRPDLVHLDRELLGFAWYVERERRRHPEIRWPAGVYAPQGWNIAALLDANPGRPVHVLGMLEPWDTSYRKNHAIVTVGLTHWLAPAAQRPSFEEWAARNRAALDGYDPAPALAQPDGTWERTTAELATETEVARALQALGYAQERGRLAAAARVAVDAFEAAIRRTADAARIGLRPGPHVTVMRVEPAFYKNLGLAYEMLAAQDAAYQARAVVSYTRYLEVAPPADPDLPAIRSYLTARGSR